MKNFVLDRIKSYFNHKEDPIPRSLLRNKLCEAKANTSQLAARFRDVNESTSAVSENVSMTKAEKKQRFMQSAGKIQIDAEAVSQLRKINMI